MKLPITTCTFSQFGLFKFNLLDYTCRARWPEGLLCSTISLKSCNLAQILQSPKSEFVTCVMFSTHTNTSLIKPHLTELDEIHRNRPKSNYNLAKNLQSWSVTSDTRTHTRTEIHTFFIWYPRVGREHNSPSGNNYIEVPAGGSPGPQASPRSGGRCVPPLPLILLRKFLLLFS